MDCNWIAGCRWNGESLNGGYLPASYTDLLQLVKDHPEAGFRPPYIWMIYAPPKMGKTRLIASTFPKPMKLYDLDRGSSVLGTPEEIKAQGIDLRKFNSEEGSDYDLFTADIASCF
jgi:hypothetical protein